MEKNEQKRSKKTKRESKITSADSTAVTKAPIANAQADTTAPVTGERVGTFLVGEIGSGEVKVVRERDRLRLAFEVELKDPESTQDRDVWLDVVLGPTDWHHAANAFEIKSVPLLSNVACADVALADVRMLAHDGRLQFYARAHIGDAEYFLNRDGRPYANFEIAVHPELD